MEKGGRERIVTPAVHQDDLEGEYSLRPRRLAEYIGQDQVKETISVFIQAARQRAEILALPRLADRLDAWLALGDGVLPPRGRRRELAAELGVTPEALYRELARRRARTAPLTRPG